jgi:hypothetical protein
MTWGNFREDSVSESYKKMKAEELKGNQHKLDKNKNGKVDGHDFKLLRKEDAVEEAANKSDIPAYQRKDDKLTLADLEKERTQNKSHSVQLAKNNGTMKKEAVEELDEISKDTLKSYVKGAKGDVAAHKDQKSSAIDQGDHKTASDSAAAIAKRQAGMKAAKAKLNNEEAEVNAEELVEYETDKNGRFINKAKPGVYGGSEKEKHVVDTLAGPKAKELDDIEKKKKIKKEGLDLFSEREIDSLISEVLKASDDAGKWISDFTKSDDPRFEGDSKEQRKKRALAAYYAAQKKESVDYDSFLEEAAQGDIVKMNAKAIKHGNVKDKDDEKDVMEPNSEGEADFLDKHSVQVTDDPAAAAGNDQTGKSKVSTATGPKGQGAGKYDGKGKTGIKEDATEDDIAEAKAKSCGTEEDNSGKKSYTTFKEKINKKGC